ncbi:acyl-CoA synthetase short chain family member 2 like isoform X1, partial [Tachysurus ichikawai]
QVQGSAQLSMLLRVKGTRRRYDFNSYLATYKRSTEDPEEFWREVAQDFYLYKPLTGQMLQYNFDMTKDQVYINFMEGAKTNMCYSVLDHNMLDRNLGEKVAYHW